MSHYQALRAQLDNHPRMARGWQVRSITPTMELRIFADANNPLVHLGFEGIKLQQLFTVQWQHEREQHTGGGYYSNFDSTSEWLNVPTVTEP